MKLITLSFLFYFLFLKLALSEEIFGLPVITDGDTIKISNNKIRLHGIDAPEKKQKCLKNAKEYKNTINVKMFMVYNTYFLLHIKPNQFGF